MHGIKPRPIQLLIAEDSEDDALLIKRELIKGGYQPHMRRVESAAQMQDALENQNWDLIITDHNMPSFDSNEALELATKYGNHAPFILVSGSIGEEVAVDAMKAGAHDYVMKNNLARLLPAIDRELKEAENRRAHQEAEALIRHMAFHDSLTDLINRAEFERRLEESVVAASTDGEAHALLYLDLDQFKLVNDSCGHVAGDELLKRITRRLQATIRDSDTLARLGGDEFGVLLKNCPLDRAKRIARAVLETIQSYNFVWAGNSFKIGVSIGLVQVKGNLPSSELLTLADMACYVAKDEGRNRIHVTTNSDSTITRRQGEIQWIQRLQEGMVNDSLMLYRQHIQNLQQDRPHSELLLRMIDQEDGSIITPDRFIPAAERYNLMPEVDRWVVHHAFSQFALQRPANSTSHPYDTLFINLSANTLSDTGMVDYIRQQLQEFDIPAAGFGFEITETAAITDFDNAIKLIDALQTLGCKVALDDFGTGMSSFSYLKSLNVDFVKIDGSFVKAMLDNDMDSAIVEAINNIGHIAGLQTIAEYVENDAIMQRLRALGVDFAQGWAVHRPEPYTCFQPAIAQ